MAWQGVAGVTAYPFTCGHCGNVVAADKGYMHGTGPPGGMIYVCPHCDKPTYVHRDSQLPGVAPGAEVKGVPEDVAQLYRQARNCVAASAYTASVLVCRKLLMNIAVGLGATPGEAFVQYVQYLADKGYVPPNGKTWVDHIRKKGNEATHEIVLMSKPDAEDLIVFAEMLLKFIYEFPSRVPPPQ